MILLACGGHPGPKFTAVYRSMSDGSVDAGQTMKGEDSF